MQKVLINAQTIAQTVTVTLSNVASVLTKGLSGAESIAVNIETGTTFEPVFNSGSAVVIDTSSPQILINHSGNYQFVKGSTTNPVTLQVND